LPSLAAVGAVAQTLLMIPLPSASAVRTELISAATCQVESGREANLGGDAELLVSDERVSRR